MTTFKSITVNHNKKKVVARFEGKQTLYLDYESLDFINGSIGEYYHEIKAGQDVYDLYLKLVPHTLKSKPVYL